MSRACKTLAGYLDTITIKNRSKQYNVAESSSMFGLSKRPCSVRATVRPRWSMLSCQLPVDAEDLLLVRQQPGLLACTTDCCNSTRISTSDHLQLIIFIQLCKLHSYTYQRLPATWQLIWPMAPANSLTQALVSDELCQSVVRETLWVPGCIMQAGMEVLRASVHTDKVI
jgi:hypothetical protein